MSAWRARGLVGLSCRLGESTVVAEIFARLPAPGERVGHSLAFAAAAAFVFVAGGSQQQEASDYSGPSSEPSLPKAQYEPAAERAAAPGVDVTAAPGVAFNYRYAFRLPSENISGVQEAHAQACEKPILIRIETNSAHGASGLEKQLETAADIYSFILHNMGLTPALPGSRTTTSTGN